MAIYFLEIKNLLLLKNVMDKVMVRWYNKSVLM